ncbi:MAG: 3D domain-containing protein [Verrucomicrobiota bacterium]
MNLKSVTLSLPTTNYQLRTVAALVATCLLASCAHHPLPAYERPLPRMAVEKVRTTAYTHTEADHCRYGYCSALGTKLQHGKINSAAADWSRWPAGTKFRIKATGEIFIIDDYGFALAGTNTIDLYKPTRSKMREWGVRRVTIEILEWGDPWKSYIYMARVKGYRHIKRMMQEMEHFYPDHRAKMCPVVGS